MIQTGHWKEASLDDQALPKGEQIHMELTPMPKPMVETDKAEYYSRAQAEESNR